MRKILLVLMFAFTFSGCYTALETTDTVTVPYGYTFWYGYSPYFPYYYFPHHYYWYPNYHWAPIRHEWYNNNHHPQPPKKEEPNRNIGNTRQLEKQRRH